MLNAPDVPDATIEALGQLCHGRRVAVLTGAGCSTESGIPDYRGPETRRRAQKPIQFQELVRDPEARRRYWARSVVGFPRIAHAEPNAAHVALAQLEARGIALGVITQNVDGLHQRAGSRRVVELHGTLSRVRCLDCGARVERRALQQRLLAENPDFVPGRDEAAPDGDARLDADRVRGFRVVDCDACGGMLKPDVVFFGEGVPREVVDDAFGLLDQAECLLIVGSSLAVFSGYRFARRAAERGLAIAVVNLGESRGDGHATLRVDGRAGDVLPRLERWLCSSQGREPL